MLTLKDLSEVISMVGCYCKWEWNSSRKTTIGAIHRECKQKLMAQPRNLLRVETASWTAFKRHLQRVDLTGSDFTMTVEGDEALGGGALTIVSDTATPEPRKIMFEVTDDWVLLCNQPKARIAFEDIRIPATPPYLNEAWDSTSEAIIPHLHPCRSFRKTLDYHVGQRDLMSDILNQRFKKMNQHTLDWLPKQHRDSFSSFARGMLLGKQELLEQTSRVYLAFLYMFAGTDRPGAATIKTTTIVDQALSLMADSGMFRWQPEGNGGHWLLYDTLYVCPEDRRPVQPSTLVLTGLEGYRFDNPRKRKPDCNFDTAVKRLAK